jgi:hypothetical protein
MSPAQVSLSRLALSSRWPLAPEVPLAPEEAEPTEAARAQVAWPLAVRLKTTRLAPEPPRRRQTAARPQRAQRAEAPSSVSFLKG